MGHADEVTRGKSHPERGHRVTKVAIRDVFIMADALVAFQQRNEGISGPELCRMAWVQERKDPADESRFQNHLKSR